MKTKLKLGSIEKTVKNSGWSWGAFLLGPIWYFAHGVWGRGGFYLLLMILLSWTVVVPVVLWFVMGAKFNSERYETLLTKGYREARQ